MLVLRVGGVTALALSVSTCIHVALRGFPQVLFAIPFARQSHLASKHKLLGASRKGALWRAAYVHALRNEKVRL